MDFFGKTRKPETVSKEEFEIFKSQMITIATGAKKYITELQEKVAILETLVECQTQALSMLIKKVDPVGFERIERSVLYHLARIEEEEEEEDITVAKIPTEMIDFLKKHASAQYEDTDEDDLPENLSQIIKDSIEQAINRSEMNDNN